MPWPQRITVRAIYSTGSYVVRPMQSRDCRDQLHDAVTVRCRAVGIRDQQYVEDTIHEGIARESPRATGGGVWGGCGGKWESRLGVAQSASCI